MTATRTARNRRGRLRHGSDAWWMQRKNGGTDAIRIARPEHHTAGYRTTPERKVVPGYASSIPAFPPLTGAG